MFCRLKVVQDLSHQWYERGTMNGVRDGSSIKNRWTDWNAPLLKAPKMFGCPHLDWIRWMHKTAVQVSTFMSFIIKSGSNHQVRIPWRLLKWLTLPFHYLSSRIIPLTKENLNCLVIVECFGGFWFGLREPHSLPWGGRRKLNIQLATHL